MILKKEILYPEQISSRPICSGIYDVIYADPPWKYDFMKVNAWATENHYPTMDVESICNLHQFINSIAAENSVLFLWATSPKLPQALQVMAAWGFTYKSQMIWVKHTNRAGMGYWSRIGHELLLIGTRGKVSPPPPERRFPSVLEIKKGRHSEKPAEFRQVIEEMLPDARRIELFARGEEPSGWRFWGDEVYSR